MTGGIVEMYGNEADVTNNGFDGNVYSRLHDNDVSFRLFDVHLNDLDFRAA